MLTEKALKILLNSKKKIYNGIKEKFSQVENNNFKDLNSYFFEMDKIVRGYSLKIISKTSRKGYPYYFLELKTSRNAQMMFCEEIFSSSVNHNKLVYANTYLGFILSSNIEFLRNSINKELKNNKLIPLRWTHISDSESKTVYLHIPRGEIFYFKNKAQHQKQFTKEWLKMLVKPPIAYYTLNNQRYNITRNGLFINYNGETLPTSVQSKKMFHCFKQYMFYSLNNKLIRQLQKLPGVEDYFWNKILSNKEEEFWYYNETSSTDWASRHAFKVNVNLLDFDQ